MTGIVVQAFVAGRSAIAVEHCHDCPAVLCAAEGAVTVRTAKGSWLLPPGPVLWLPPWTRFRIEAGRPTTVHLFYPNPDPDDALVRPAAVLSADDLLTAILTSIRERGALGISAPDRRLAAVLVDRLREAPALPLLVRTPPARAGVAPAPAGLPPPLPRELAARVGVCRRTMERAFAREVGLTPGAWRQQVRFTRAVELLAQGTAVKDVALAIGYRTPSAFVAAFKRAMGTTPRRFIESEKRKVKSEK